MIEQSKELVIMFSVVFGLSCGAAAYDPPHAPELPESVELVIPAEYREAEVIHHDPEGLMELPLKRWHAAIGVELEDLPNFAIYTADFVDCGDDDATYLGCAYAKRDGFRALAILRGMPESVEEAVLVHEVGHLLGSGHTEGGVMNEGVGGGELITQAAIDQVCAAGLVPCRWQEPED